MGLAGGEIGEGGTVPVGEVIRAELGFISDVPCQESSELLGVPDEVKVADEEEGGVGREVSILPGVTEEGDDAVHLFLALGVRVTATEVGVEEDEFCSVDFQHDGKGVRGVEGLVGVCPVF